MASGPLSGLQSEAVALAHTAQGVASVRQSAVAWIAGRAINVVRLAEPAIYRCRFDYRQVHMGDMSAHDRAYYKSKGSASMSAYMHGLHSKSNVARVCSACYWMARQVCSSYSLFHCSRWVHRMPWAALSLHASGVASL